MIVETDGQIGVIHVHVLLINEHNDLLFWMINDY